MSQVQIYVLYLSLRTKINNFLRLQNEVGLQNSTFKPKINLIKACKVFLVKLQSFNTSYLFEVSYFKLTR